MNKKNLLYTAIFLIILFSKSITGKQVYSTQESSIVFVENKGQLRNIYGESCSEILFFSHSKTTNAFIKKNGISYVSSSQQDSNTVLCRTDMEFENANSGIVTKGYSIQKAYFNYYSQHSMLTNLSAYDKIICSNIYDNIDVLYYAGGKNGTKYDIIVKPHGKPEQIKIKYSGVQKIQITNTGELKITTDIGEMREYIPRVYQKINGNVIDIKAEYVIEGNLVSFIIAPYDKSNALVIDPWVTYLGAGTTDNGYGVTTDNAGNVFVTGSTSSLTFPSATGTFQTANAGGLSDAFVSKYSPSGNLLWSTYFGGNGKDVGTAIASDGINIVITGETKSGNFPFTTGMFQTTYGGSTGIMGGDAFLSKFNNNGGLTWSTFYGGPNDETGLGIDINTSGEIIFCGHTNSPSFPITTGSFQTTYQGGTGVQGAGFVAKFDATGNRIWASFSAGNKEDYATGVAFDNTGDVFLTGYTNSDNFSTTLGAFQTNIPGSFNNLQGFIQKINGSGTTIVWCSYIGGTDGYTNSNTVDVDQSNNVIIAGYTGSLHFPVTTGVYQTNPNWTTSSENAFVAKFTGANGTLQWSTYLGGGNSELVSGISVDANNNIYVCGFTTSNNFPVTSCAYQTTFAGGPVYWERDYFISKLNSTGTALLASTFLGGNGKEDFYGYKSLAINNNFVYVTGNTSGGTFPVTTGSSQSTYGGGYSDAFVAQLCGLTCGTNEPTLNFSSNTVSICQGEIINFTDNSSICDATGSSWQWVFSGGTPSSSTQQNPIGITYNTPGTYDVKLILITPCGTDSVTYSNYISVNPSPSASISGINVICFGSSTTLSVASGAGSYSWNTNANTNTITVSPSSNSVYTATVTNAQGCSSVSSATVYPVTIPTANINGASNVCSGESLTLTASGGLNYLWSTGNTENIINVIPTTPTNYSVVVSIGSCTASATHAVSILTSLTVDAGINITIKRGTTTPLSALGSGGNYSWSPSEGLSCTNCQSPIANPTTTTKYYVISYNTSTGCFAIDSVLIIVTDAGDCDDIFIPNAFSPNADGANDVFKIYGNCFDHFLLTITDRWGEKVFESSNPEFGWNGIYKNKELDTDVFFYQFSYVSMLGENILQTGNISLIR